MTDDGFSFDLTGPGPFELPLLAEFESVHIPEGKDWVLVELRSEEGKTLYVPISNRAVAPLIEALSVVPIVRGTVVPFPKPEGE